MLTSRGLGRVLGDLASMGFDARWGVLGAADIGANHQRDRIWIVGKTTNSSSHRSQKQANEFVLESKGSSKLQFEQSRDTTEMGNTNNDGQIASEIREIAEPRSNDNKAKQNETIESQGSGEQHETLAYSRCQLWDEGNSGDLDTQEEIGTSSPILNQSGGQGCGEDQVADTREIRPCGKKTEQGLARKLRFAECGVDRNWWQREPEFVPRTTQRNMGGVVDGLASRVDRLKAIGNGQVPLCAATAWRILSEQK
jgi:DNA (cytosine-5)-methyltransferase 1